MPIVPLPVFETDADPRHRTELTADELAQSLEMPESVIARFGYMRLIGEFDYSGDSPPVCGARLVARTHRGTELVTMVTTACQNTGCQTAITREELHDYIEQSGGREFPFQTGGRILRIAAVEDLNKQQALDNDKAGYITACKEHIAELELEMKLIDVEPILGGELLTFYYMAEERVDFRELVKRLAGQFKARIEMRQVGARDEARLVADYERCGQHCCCRSYLKVLKPVSMKSAKIQKATLDPLKISGRCGRLMCCLRYEDKTYKELRARLPKKNTRVGTMEGPGVVIETRTIVQLVLVRLEQDDREIAVQVDDLMDPETCPRTRARDAQPVMAEDSFKPFHSNVDSDQKDADSKPEGEDGGKDRTKRKRRRRRRKPKSKQDGKPAAEGAAGNQGSPASSGSSRPAGEDESSGKPARSKSRRRRRRPRRSGGSSGKPPSGGGGGGEKPDSPGGGG